MFCIRRPCIIYEIRILDWFKGAIGKILVILFPVSYLIAINLGDLSMICSITDESTRFTLNRRMMFDTRPALLTPVVAGLMISAISITGSKKRARIEHRRLVCWVAFGVLLCLYCKPTEVFLGKSSTLLFAILLANAIYFACLLCDLPSEERLRSRLLQYAKWLPLLFVYYYCIWIPPFVGIWFVRWVALVAIGMMFASAKGRIYLNKHVDVKYLALMTGIHASIMILSRQEILV